MGPLSRFLFPDGLAEGARSSEQVSSRRAETCRGQFSFWAVFFLRPALTSSFLLGSEEKCGGLVGYFVFRVH